MKSTPMLPLFVTLFSLVASQVNPATYWGSAGYPPCTEQCLENVYENQACTLPNSCFCTASTSTSTSCLCLTSACLCETSSWLIAVAQCIGKTCGADNVTTAAYIAEQECLESDYPLVVASAAIVSYGMAAIPTGSSTPTTAGTTSSPTPTSNSGSTTSLSPNSSPGSTANPTIANPNPATTSTASTSSGTSGSGTGGGSQPNPIIAAYVLPAVAMVVSVITWWFKRRDIQRCCCGVPEEDDRDHAPRNSIAMHNRDPTKPILQPHVTPVPPAPSSHHVWR